MKILTCFKEASDDRGCVLTCLMNRGLGRGSGSWRLGQIGVESIMWSVEKKRPQGRQRYPSSFEARCLQMQHLTRSIEDFTAAN